MHRWMGVWMDKTDRNAYTSYGTKEFAKSFECMFNFSYFKRRNITFNDTTNPVGHLCSFTYMYIISQDYLPAVYIFSIICSNKCMWALQSFDKGLST